MTNIPETTPPKYPTKYPIITETIISENPSTDRKNKEELVFKYFSKKGYRRIGSENEPISHLFLHLCFEKFLLSPNWNIYRGKTLIDFPHLTDHLNYTMTWDIEEYKKYKTLQDMVVHSVRRQMIWYRFI